jgi:hypothetical protein
VSLILCLGLVGCGDSPPSASPTSQAAIATGSLPLTFTPSATPVVPPARAKTTPKPVPTPPPTWTKLERAIRDGIRADLRASCAPRRQTLPPGTIAAVDCQPGRDPVSRVGFYLFADAADALDVYLTRVRAEGLALGSEEDSGSEGATHCNDVYPDDDTIHCRDREAFFVNADGYANYRVVRGRLYIGALGTNGDIYPLNEWAWRGSEPVITGQDRMDLGGVPSYQTLWCDGKRPKPKLPLCVR